MAKWGKADFSEFRKLADTFKKALDERVVERLIQDILLELAFRAEAKIKRRTPVDTGALRRNWKVSKVIKKGNTYEVEISNNTEYAQFVEFGHRYGIDLTKWKEGRYMMTISMKEVEREMAAVIQKRQLELLNNLMNGRPARKGR